VLGPKMWGGQWTHMASVCL